MKTCIVVTSISGPNRAMRQLAEGALSHGYEFIVVGDTKSPVEFLLHGCKFLGIEAQLDSNYEYAHNCPTGHYARKNVGYLVAMSAGAQCVLETDDDNLPLSDFFRPGDAIMESSVIEHSGWVNMYKYFTDVLIWPRGFPLNMIHSELPAYEALPLRTVDCPIHQGLAQTNPDVDAIYRLILPLPQNFRNDRQIALGPGSWCPFNSQNTIWYPQAYPLMYLPAHCSFRMTDIWRSFVAQRICHLNGWGILFRPPTVSQERNEHDLMYDFSDETIGYLNNYGMMKELEKLDLQTGPEHIELNMMLCYEVFVKMGLVGEAELPLLDAWFRDLARIRSNNDTKPFGSCGPRGNKSWK